MKQKRQHIKDRGIWKREGRRERKMERASEREGGGSGAFNSHIKYITNQGSF